MRCVYDVFLLFFFFQAEDGIRDGRVTGVQTCALPISNPLASCGGCLASFVRTARRQSSRPSPASVEAMRSEESRVGKECRTRGGADDLKKKKISCQQKEHTARVGAIVENTSDSKAAQL